MILMPIAKDHNYCPHCKLAEITVGDYHQRSGILRRDARNATGARVDEMLTEAALLEGKGASVAEGLAAHLADDIAIRAYLSAIRQMAVLLRQHEEASRGWSATKSFPFNSRCAIVMFHIDDKTRWEWPRTLQESQQPLHKFGTDENGQFNIVFERQTNYLAGGGSLNKDSDHIICDILMNVLESLNGERTLQLILDNCSNNKNARVAMMLPMFLVDMGFVSVCEVGAVLVSPVDTTDSPPLVP
jgi:hypothetical protein